MKLAVFLLASSAVIYIAKELTLHNSENTLNYLFNALGFLPVNVLLVTIVLNGLLSIRSKREKLEKLNMVIGTFFSETGTSLLAVLSDHDPDLDKIRPSLLVDDEWDDKAFERVDASLRDYKCEISVSDMDLEALAQFLKEKRNFLLRLLENPVLLEHESFTELLRAVFHLTEEMERRDSLSALPETDRVHIEGDINRVYGLLICQWLDYMHYMKGSYPYLFSLAMRTNPFDEDASPVVR